MKQNLFSAGSASPQRAHEEQGTTRDVPHDASPSVCLRQQAADDGANALECQGSARTLGNAGIATLATHRTKRRTSLEDAHVSAARAWRRDIANGACACSRCRHGQTVATGGGGREGHCPRRRHRISTLPHAPTLIMEAEPAACTSLSASKPA
jgi:hypothetical protein